MIDDSKVRAIRVDGQWIYLKPGSFRTGRHSYGKQWWQAVNVDDDVIAGPVDMVQAMKLTR